MKIDSSVIDPSLTMILNLSITYQQIGNIQGLQPFTKEKTHLITVEIIDRYHVQVMYLKSWKSCIISIKIISAVPQFNNKRSKKVDLEMYIPCTICVFGGTPFRCLAWLSSI